MRLSTLQLRMWVAPKIKKETLKRNKCLSGVRLSVGHVGFHHPFFVPHAQP